jgi:hypothetical protein
MGLMVALALSLAAGCATPAARIRRNPQMFASFPPGVQENVRHGRIELGYTRDMVFIALGAPDRVYARTTVSTNAEVWAYMSAYVSTEPVPVVAPGLVRDAQGNYYVTDGGGWLTVLHEREYERLRVEFQDGKVVALERLRQ